MSCGQAGRAVVRSADRGAADRDAGASQPTASSEGRSQFRPSGASTVAGLPLCVRSSHCYRHMADALPRAGRRALIVQ